MLRKDGVCSFDYGCSTRQSPRCNLNKANNMGKKNNKAKREQAAHVEEKPASETKPATPAEKAQATREKLNFTEAQLIEAVKSVDHAASSREISDKLGIKDPDQGRAYVRSRMAPLMENKKILGIEPEGKSRCTFLYSVVE
jgi:hypothetical protein